MGSIRVVSKRKYGVRADGHTEHVIAIDRPSGSVLANQHHMAHEICRGDVIARFRADLPWTGVRTDRCELKLNALQSWYAVDKTLRWHAGAHPRPVTVT